MKEHVNTFLANPVQKNFIESRADADLFSSRVGEGKSAALVWSTFVHSRLNPGAEWAILRDTFENIQRTTQKEFFKWFPPGIYGEYNVQRKEFRWASGICEGGSVTFLGMDDPKDASKLLSWELSGIAMDEPAPAVGSAGIDEMIFDLGLTRLRKPLMKWYPMKLATNNPDEQHWTYTKFVSPGVEGMNFKVWQPSEAENSKNLPVDYYERMRRTLANRPDLIRRFVDGKFGFQQIGKSVTPQWNDDIHLANGLYPLKGIPLHLLWDFGHNPTCLITQRTPSGHWHFLDAFVGQDLGVEELIEGWLIPLLAARYRGNRELQHIGDPAGKTGEQTSIRRSAVKSIRHMVGGTWRDGPGGSPFTRIYPLQAVLSRTSGGTGIIQVDKERAKPVWHALRGGWHFNVSRENVASSTPVKDIHSHPGDAAGYGAAILFPTGQHHIKPVGLIMPNQAPGYFGTNPEFRIGPEHTGPIPAHGDRP